MWTYHNPVRITFGAGAGALGTLGEALAGRPHALVTYADGPFPALAGRLADRVGPPLVTVDGVLANPDMADLRPLAAGLAEAWPEVQAVVALGGGSAMDAAKALVAARGDFARVERHLRGGGRATAGDLGRVPIIAVPTTAGTGSEVTCWATVWDRATGAKFSLSEPFLYPERAIIDPDLALGSPRDLTVSTGLDALSHALESLWNVNANPVTRDYAVAAARLALATLPRLVDDLDNRTLRAAMARAALLAGLAFSNTRTALAHNISYAVTVNHGLAHGYACSFCLPFVMRLAVGRDADCDAALTAVFDAPPEAGADRLERFLNDLDLSTDPADHGIGAVEWDGLVHAAAAGPRGRNFIGTVPN